MCSYNFLILPEFKLIIHTAVWHWLKAKVKLSVYLCSLVKGSECKVAHVWSVVLHILVKRQIPVFLLWFQMRTHIKRIKLMKACTCYIFYGLAVIPLHPPRKHENRFCLPGFLIRALTELLLLEHPVFGCCRTVCEG